MTKRCYHCKQEKPATAFYKSSANTCGLTSYCVECNKKVHRERYLTDSKRFCAQSRLWYRENLERARKRARLWNKQNPAKVLELQLRKIGLTVEEYTLLLKKSEGRCALCQKKPKSLVRDHNHITGKFRDFLCHCCNTGLGKFGDCANRLRAAADYIEKHL